MGKCRETPSLCPNYLPQPCPSFSHRGQLWEMPYIYPHLASHMVPILFPCGQLWEMPSLFPLGACPQVALTFPTQSLVGNIGEMPTSHTSHRLPTVAPTFAHVGSQFCVCWDTILSFIFSKIINKGAFDLACRKLNFYKCVPSSPTFLYLYARLEHFFLLACILYAISLFPVSPT